MDQRTVAKIVAWGIFSLMTPPAILAASPVPEMLLEDFSKEMIAAPPSRWKAKGGKAEEEYLIQQEDGNRFLHADAKGKDIWFGLSLEKIDGGQNLDPKKWPVLSWKWRAHEFPLGADERKKKTQDSAAGVYVVFPGMPVPRTLKYVWSAILPQGAELPSPATNRTRIVVLESGPRENLSEWIVETVNYYEDYKKFFGDEPDSPRGIAVLTDADATKSHASADYDDFRLLAN